MSGAVGRPANGVLVCALDFWHVRAKYKRDVKGKQPKLSLHPLVDDFDDATHKTAYRLSSKRHAEEEARRGDLTGQFRERVNRQRVNGGVSAGEYLKH